MGVVVAVFVNPPAFAYIVVGRYFLSPGPLILHDGRPVANVGISLVGGWEREGFVKMKYDFRRTSFS